MEPSMTFDPSRRRLLRGTGAVVVGAPVAGWLAACSKTEPGTGASTGSVLDRGRDQGYLTVAVFNEPPYTKLEPDGTVTGAEPDVLRAVVKRLGIDDIKGERVEYESMIPALKAGRVEYRVEKAGIVHVPIGKVSFGTEKLIENARALVASLVKAKPASAKGNYLMSVAVSSTMGPGVKVDALALRAAA